MRPSGVRQVGAEFSGWSHLGASCVVLLLGNLPGTAAEKLHSFPENEKIKTNVFFTRAAVDTGL